jgi:hypothetical protein
MTDQKLNDLALQAWKEGMGDALTAVKLLRDWTDLGLREALEHRSRRPIGGCSQNAVGRPFHTHSDRRFLFARKHPTAPARLDVAA